MKDKLAQLKKIALKEISKAPDAQIVRELEIKYLGRKGELNKYLKKIKDLPPKLRPSVGRLANEVKEEITQVLKKTKAAAEKSIAGGVTDKYFDITIPGQKTSLGHFHPITQFLEKVVDIFISMGFEVVEGPEVELAKYNFDLLNIPKDHPARDVWDTFYISKGKKDKTESEVLLRTHTSPVQLRAMEKRKPPARLIVPGRVFRHEATDSSHETTFYQIEGLVIDKGVRVTDLIGTLETFLKRIFGEKVKTRVRPHFYPFVEPGMDIDMKCILCKGRGCSVCGTQGWLEMVGSGMVHPQVLKNMKINPQKYSGFAFGWGIDRLMMLYYGISDIRLSYSGDLRFLRQF